MKRKKEKKPYAPPILKGLTQEQAVKLLADRKNCSEEEATEFLKSLRKRKQCDSTDQQQKHSA